MMLVDLGQRVSKQELQFIIECVESDIQFSLSLCGIARGCEVKDKEAFERYRNNLINFETNYAYSKDNLKFVQDSRVDLLSKIDLLMRLYLFLEEKK